MQESSRVVINTTVQYFRSIVSVIITLYTSRIVLYNLGVDDFGIYSLIAGVITMFSFIQSSLAKTTQRYLSYHYGKRNKQIVIEIFNNSVITQLIIALILCGLLVLLSSFVFNKMIVIPLERLDAAKIVYYIMIGSLFCNLLSTPYLATLISRENIIYSSVVQIIDAFLKIPIAISLVYISDNKLEYYSLFCFFLVFFNLLLYYTYCISFYDECKHFSFRSFKISLFKDMFSFAGWNVYSTMCIVGRGQGIAVLLNNFYSTAINAAYSIGNQVSSQIAFLSNSLTTAINPQIMKAEGSGDRYRMIRLSELSCKYSFLLMSMASIPAIIYMPTILSIWLKEVPEHSVMFCRMILLAIQIDLISMNLSSTNQAIGNIRNFVLFIQTAKVVTLPTVYVALRLGGSPFIVMVIYVVFEFLCAVLRVGYLKYDINMSVKHYVKNVVFACLSISFINALICFLISKYLNGWFFLITCFISIIVTMVLILLIGMNPDEKIIFTRLINKLRRIIKR